MELPHLTLHLRRIGRGSAWGIWLAFAAMGVLIVLRLVFGGMGAHSPAYGIYALGSLLIGGYIGTFLLYWLVAKVLDIMDAYVDAQFQTYDVSDITPPDLAE